MIHLLCNGTPLCTHSIGKGQKCQYATRREAFDRMVRLEREFPKIEFSLVRGHCPTSFRPCPPQPQP
jgi:hypothetical protein